MTSSMDWRKTRIDCAGSPLHIQPPAGEQVGGTHYQTMKMQPFEYIFKNHLDFFQGSVVKYVSRWRNKNGIEDLRKAKNTLERYNMYLLEKIVKPDVTQPIQMHFPEFSMYVTVCHNISTVSAKEYCDINEFDEDQYSVIDCITKKNSTDALIYLEKYIENISLP